MASQFTHLKYDEDAYHDHVDRSTAPFLYQVNSHFSTNPGLCYSPHGPNGTNYDPFSDNVDINSWLRGLDKYHTKANYYDSAPPNPKNNTPLCHTPLQSNESRFEDPKYYYRGKPLDDLRFQYLYHDPQKHIFEDSSMNSRQYIKDNHKTNWQTPIDQSDSFPQSNVGCPTYNFKKLEFIK